MKTTEAMDSTKMKIARRNIVTNVIAFQSNVQSERTWRSDSEFTESPSFYWIPVSKSYYYFRRFAKKVCVNQQNDSDIDAAKENFNVKFYDKISVYSFTFLVKLFINSWYQLLSALQ